MSRIAHKRTYLDPIHQDIVLDRDKPAERLVMDLIDTEEFQRMRRVHQLGVSYFTFQGAEGSRFTHSVGVMHVASQLVNMVSERTDGIEEQRPLILASALLHDIGHGPYSHVTEKILHYDHEDWSCKIISGDTQVHEVLDKFDDKMADNIVKVLKKTYYPKYVSHIISSQLDVDRFDYLLRDSYMTGTAYGLFALQRILRSLEIDQEEDRIVVVGEKGQTAVEDYLFARYSMYAQVYYHRKNLAARALLNQLVNRARHLMKQGNGPLSFIDGPTRKWLTGEKLTVQEYLTLDDVQMTYHIKQWSQDPDPVLADLASRFLHRRLFKATKIPFHDQRQIDDLLKESRKLASAMGFDPEYYVTVESTGFRPYDYYRPDSALPQTNIVVRTDTGEVNELSRLSLTVDALVKGNYESNWLVYPAEVSEKISLIKELAPAR
ncbi:HD domain-containing protein [soil metagenome]